MNVITSIRELKKHLRREQKNGRTIGFVATMGYLHEGHRRLMQESSHNHDVTVVSVFVNPLQFGPGEDFETYPRDEERDKTVCREEGVDVVFMPSAEEMYPKKMASSIAVEKGTDVLCGRSRPGHFSGVATVVMKLLQIVRPDAAYFGQKDAQQAAVLETMAADYNLDTSIRAVPTVRENDGLAKSSRNVRLSEAERKEAPAIYESLKAGVDTYRQLGKQKAVEQVSGTLAGLSGTVDYVELWTYPDLQEPGKEAERLVLAAAVQYDHARLIDNIIFIP
ncbi:pantoate--beta-alanine ligase [Alkalicoccus urumqiensis]|uniref:Pantothenate synthetase n=1 Tax=Alkalicoccus urumqiensis TaxID=1548213 RepID=A0A2P6MKR3_ALKUR|nr:pantoate--beta-alanine ligase [Alkalicoccus urumqiensis]PRO66841.1 pantoate--beta-alanine ligase [Alkalicoccus urumqiensis]